MKRIDTKKSIIIIGITLLCSLLFAFVIIYLNRDPVQVEIELEQPKDVVDDKFSGSLVKRKEEKNRVDLFNYDTKISVKEKKEYKGKFYELEEVYDKVTLNDGTNIYLKNILKDLDYTIKEKGNGIEITTSYHTPYTLEMIKINNEEYKFVYDKLDFGKDEVLTKYYKIVDDYKLIYDSTEYHSAMEFGGIGTYIDFVDFIEENNLQKDIGLYTANQVKQICEKAFDMKFDDSYYEAQSAYSYTDNVISYQLEKTISNDRDDSFTLYSYYLMGDGKNIYACKLSYKSLPDEDFKFKNILFYVLGDIM